MTTIAARIVMTLMACAFLAACSRPDAVTVPPIGRPDTLLLSEAGDSAFVTDANSGRSRPAGSDERQRAGSESLSDAPPDVRPFVGETAEVADWETSPDGRKVALAVVPRPPDVAGAPAETAVTVVTYEPASGREVGRYEFRVRTGAIDVEWSPSSQWVFVTQDAEHVIAYRPEQAARSMRQLNVPDAREFETAPLR